MPDEIIAMISAIAAVVACLAAVFLVFVTWRQSSISDRQKTILDEQKEISRKQAYYQGQQTTILKQHAKIMERQAEISDQQLNIIKDQETDRKNAAMSANLVIKSKVVEENALDLIFENNGPGWAREIKMYVNGCRLEDYPPEICRLRSGSVAQTEIGPGNTLNYLLEFHKEPAPTTLRIDVSWVSDNGIHNTNLAFLNPHIQFEFYKKGNQTKNNYRVQTYRKFLEVQSARRVDETYFANNIIPLLEQLQINSSPRVKEVADDILAAYDRMKNKSSEVMAGSMFIGFIVPTLMSQIDKELIPIIKEEMQQ